VVDMATKYVGKATFKNGRLVTPSKGWHQEPERHSLAAKGIKTGVKAGAKPAEKRGIVKTPMSNVEKLTGPDPRDSYDTCVDNLMVLELENNTKYYNKEIDYDNWEESNDIITLSKTNLQNCESPNEMNDFVSLTNDALKGINRMGFYYKVGAYDKIREI